MNNVCLPRSGETTLALVEKLDPETKYLPEDLDGDGDEETKCNLFVFAFCFYMGVEMPRKLARLQIAWLRGPEGKRAGWRRCTAEVGIVRARLGHPVLATWLNPIEAQSSHVAVGVPELPTTDPKRLAHHSEPFIAQAGRSCFNNAPVTWGFGTKVVEWWTAE